MAQASCQGATIDRPYADSDLRLALIRRQIGLKDLPASVAETAGEQFWRLLATRSAR